MDDLLGVVVVLGEDQGLGQPVAAAVREQLGEHAVAVGLQHGADLVGVDHGAVELLGAVGQVGIEVFVAHTAGALVAHRHLKAGVALHGATLLGDAGADAVDLVADVDAVGHRALVGVFGHQVLVEKAERVLRRRSREADDAGVEVLQHLPPQAVDGAVAFVGDDEIEGLDGDVRVVGERQRLAVLALPLLEAGAFLVLLGQFLAAQQGIEALDGGDDHLGVRVDARAVQVLDDVGVGEAVGGARRVEVLKLLQRLVAEVVAVHQEQNAFGARLANQPPGERAGGEGLAGAGGELNQRPGPVLGQRSFKAGDGLDLAVAQTARVERRHLPQPGAQGVGLAQPVVQRLGAVKGEQPARARLGVAPVAEEGLGAGALVVVDEQIVPAGEVLRQAQHVLLGLLGDAAQGHAGLLGLDDACGLAGDEQQVVAGPGRQREFTHRHAQGRVAVEVVPVLQYPAGSTQ